MLFVVHYSEIALKGKNRKRFVKKLIENIKEASRKKIIVRKPWGRILIEANEDISSSLSKVFGISWFARVHEVKLDFNEIEKKALELIRQEKVNYFSVKVKRANKKFSMTSLQIASKLGDSIKRETGKSVNLRNPELTLYVEILEDSALVYKEKIEGLGGLPVGVSGRVIHLLSGGIDSPVAAFMMMKRGCYPICLHFHPFRDNSEILGTKIRKLIEILASYCNNLICVVSPFYEYQVSTFEKYDKLEPVLFRYFMRLFAERIAPYFGARGISNGDSLSQAASQTLWNIDASDFNSNYPILRPLLCMDKEEIVNTAKRIGSYDASIMKYPDCCSIITRNPVTKVDKNLFIKEIKNIDFDSIVDKTLQISSVLTYSLRKEGFEIKSLSDFISEHKLQSSSLQARIS